MQKNIILTTLSALLLNIVFIQALGLTRAEAALPPVSEGAVVALFTPFAFFETSLKSIMTSYSTQDQASFPDQVVNVGGLNWHISGITYNIQSEFTQGALQPQSYDIQSRNLKLSIVIHQISIDQILTTQAGGVTLDIHVQATCAPITLVQNAASAGAQISYQFSPQSISTQVTQFNFQWPVQTWSISSLNCQGPAGIDSKIQAALAQNLQSADMLKPYIQNALASKIQDQVDDIVGQIKRPTPIVVAGNPLNLLITFKQFQITKLGLISYGQITWNGIPDPTHITPLAMNDVPPELVGATDPVMITANIGWSNFIKAELAAATGPTIVNLNQQESFENLLKSNFFDFWLWPDLMNYGLSSPFNLAIDTPQPDSFTWLADGTAQLQSTASAWIQSVRQNKTWNYIRIAGKANVNIAPQITAGAFSVVANVHATNIRSQFGSDYITAFHPPQFLSPLIVAEISKNLNHSFVFSSPLPSYDLGPIGTARFNGWTPLAGGGLIAIPVKMSAPVLK